MQIKSLLGTLTSILALSFAGAQAATLYVATTGSDSNPGTSAQPFRTITYAYSQASAGTTINVAPGTYTDYTSGWGLHLNKSGTASSPIVLKSTTRGGAIIDGQFASDRNKAIYLDGSYNVIDGFAITRAPNTGIFVQGNSNQILHNEIYNNGTQGSSDSEGQGIYSEQNTSGNVYNSNYIHDNGYAGSNLDHGLYLCGQNEVVANNVVLRHPSSGLQIAGYTTVSNMKVYNNVFAWNGTDGIIVWMNMNGVDIKNNIVFQNGHYGIYFYAATGSGVNMDHNLIYANGSGSYTPFNYGGSTVTYTLGTTISTDPKLANETKSGLDAHLASGSPAIGAGLNLYSTLTTDIAGAARSSSGAWDMGAYVSGSSSTDTNPPTVSLTSPAGGTMVSGSAVTVSANASDSVGIASVQFKLDGANLGSAVTASPYTMTWNTTTAAAGSHTLTAVATDTTGNQATSTAVSVNVNNTSPAVSLTAPANNSTYAAPATVSLTAGVTANGHNITAVKFYNGGTLLGQATTAPYTCAWNNVGAATYGVNATAVYDSGSTVNSSVLTVNVTNAVTVSGLTFAANSGTISAPFYVTNNNAIVQPAYTALSLGGQAVYTFNVATAGSYVINAQVNAPGMDNNSFFVNIDAQPTDPTMIWDAPVTSGFASQTVSWRGNGGANTNSLSGMDAQYAPAVFNLSAGTHQLIVRGREGLAQISSFTITPYSQAPSLPTVTVAATTASASRVGPVNGMFTLTRTGSTSAALTVNFSLTGNAANGVDYTTIPASVTIPAGAASTAVTVAPLPSATSVGSETAVLTLAANSAYAIGSANSATVTIAGNSVPSSIGNAPGHNMQVTWSSTVGKTYYVAYKTSLTDAKWTNLSGPITATGTSTSYVDSTASKSTTRYYLVYVTN